MPQNLCEYLRKQAVESCFRLGAFRMGWSVWRKKISTILGKNYNEIDVLNLGDHLASIFATTSKAGRGQNIVSGGGYGWEGLVCWYMNLCLAGTRGVVLRKASDSPLPLRDAISVNYGNFKSNTESDLTVIIFPAKSEFTSDLKVLRVTDYKGNSIATYNRNGTLNLKTILNSLCEIHFEELEMGIVQCKTNWNDNAQIPMLWSMIYQSTEFANPSISVGSNAFSIMDLARFSYSFCTVPTNQLDLYTPNSTSVNRVRNLSGGNYWGNPSRSGVASSLKEIFNVNFRNAYSSNIRKSIKTALSLRDSSLAYFDLP